MDPPPPYTEVAENPVPQPSEVIPQNTGSNSASNTASRPQARPPQPQRPSKGSHATTSNHTQTHTSGRPQSHTQSQSQSGSFSRPQAKPPASSNRPQATRPQQPQSHQFQQPYQQSSYQPLHQAYNQAAPPPPSSLRYPPNYRCPDCNNTGTKPSGSSCKNCWAMFGPRNNNVVHHTSSWRRPPGRAVRPGDPALGGVLCGRCRGSGVTHELILFEETCAVCRGVGRIL